MLEHELVNDINQYLESHGVRYSNELRMGIGIPDISFNIGANYRLKPINDYFLLSILSFVENKKQTTFIEIKNAFRLSLKQVKQRISKLANMSLVRIKNQLIIAVKSIFTTNLGTTTSVEAKLKDWKGACLQAQRYLLFSDYSYVAMPAAYIKNIDLMLFRDCEIGLLSVDGKKLTEIVPAQKSDQCNFIQKYLITSKILERYETINKRRLRNTIFTSYASK